jgi:hypothetical protein
MYQCTRGEAERTPIWLSPIWPMIEWGHVISRISMLIASLICAKQDKTNASPGRSSGPTFRGRSFHKYERPFTEHPKE